MGGAVTGVPSAAVPDDAIVMTSRRPAVCSSRRRLAACSVRRRAAHGLKKETSDGSTPYRAASVCVTAALSKEAHVIPRVRSCCTASVVTEVVAPPTGTTSGRPPWKTLSAAAPGQ